MAPPPGIDLAAIAASSLATAAPAGPKPAKPEVEGEAVPANAKAAAAKKKATPSSPGGQETAVTAAAQNEDAEESQATRQWDDSVLTVMIRQIPRHYTQHMFLMEVNSTGFEGLFDFLYLPFDSRKLINIGYGFVSFTQPQHARSFRDTFDGIMLGGETANAIKPLRVHPASVQGFDANYERFAATKMCQKQDLLFSPIFFPGGRQQLPTQGNTSTATPQHPSKADVLKMKSDNYKNRANVKQGGAGKGNSKLPPSHMPFGYADADAQQYLTGTGQQYLMGKGGGAAGVEPMFIQTPSQRGALARGVPPVSPAALGAWSTLNNMNMNMNQFNNMNGASLFGQDLLGAAQLGHNAPLGNPYGDQAQQAAALAVTQTNLKNLSDSLANALSSLIALHQANGHGVKDLQSQPGPMSINGPAYSQFGSGVGLELEKTSSDPAYIGVPHQAMGA
jgi:hypothetical protein